MSDEAHLPCPACGGENLLDAIFCAHCDKALGPFRYVREELAAAASRHEKLAERVTDFIGRPQFVLLHLAWFASWALLNAGLLAVVRRFDAYPYNLLGILLSVEGILITGFLLISQNRQQAQAEKFAELDYEVNVRSFRAIQELQLLVCALAERIPEMPHER